MRIRNPIMLLAGLTVLVVVDCQSPPPKQERADVTPSQSAKADPEKLFHEGKRLVEANCGDCQGATRANVERGVQLLQTALDDGFSRPGEAFKLLDSAYRDLMYVYAEPDSEEQAQLDRLHDQVLERWLAVDPTDPDAMLAKADNTSDLNERIAIARQVLESHPDQAQAEYLLGTGLVVLGQIDEGIPHLRSAYENAKTGIAAMGYGNKLLQVLKAAGKKAEAKRLEKEMRKRF